MADKIVKILSDSLRCLLRYLSLNNRSYRVVYNNNNKHKTKI